MLINLRREAIVLVALAPLIVVAMVHTMPLHAQDADIAKQLQEVDLAGVKQLKLSPNGELVAGLTGLSPNPGAKSGSFSLIKIWSVKKKQLVHEFSVPGQAHAVAFSPDNATVVTADGAGNLGWESTIRAWELTEGTERRIGKCGGEIGELCFSPDGVQLAAVVKYGYFDNMSALKKTKSACAGRIKVWRIAREGDLLSINITHPLGEWTEMWPPIEGWRGKRIEAAFQRVMPTKLRFSPDGKQLISETIAGFRTDYDTKSGITLRHSGMSSAGVFKSMLMLGLHEVPSGVTKLALRLTPVESSAHVSLRTDGWWQVGKAQDYLFKMDGEMFVSQVDGVVKKEDVRTVLGLNVGTNLAELESVEHPLGVIKITRKNTGLEFRLAEVNDGMESGETIQAGNVRWELSLKDQ